LASTEVNKFINFEKESRRIKRLQEERLEDEKWQLPCAANTPTPPPSSPVIQFGKKKSQHPFLVEQSIIMGAGEEEMQPHSSDIGAYTEN
jgi:hypothetical protein